MDIDLDTGKLGVFIAGLTCFFLMERLWSGRAATMPLAPRIILHSAIATLNTVVIRTLSYVPLLLWIVYVEQMGWGISRWLGMSGWTEFLVTIIILDLFDYFWHLANHRITFLWRFHKAHHSDNDMDIFTALRFHPGELLISSLVKASWVVIWGPSAIAWFLFEALVSLSAQFHHSNIQLPDHVDKRLSSFLVTPKFHTLHHLVDRSYGDKNFSTILSCWDAFFGTRAESLPNSELTTQQIGLPEGRDLTLSVSHWLLEPIKPRNLLLAKRHISQ
jgi:sterol desaturase/sphingolipid hydroxylase (fatty acid hydroxylase superfamily)